MKVAAVTRRPVLAVVLLLGLYAVASCFLDPGGTLGTDTGAKVATLDNMVETGTWRPVLPYWAEDADPGGQVHPIYDTGRVEDGWVHVTTLPMLLAARPLYELGGYRLALLLPMLGAIGAALAARSLATRLRGVDSGWTAFWVIGLASPLAVYALDLWEHSLGVACVLGAVSLLAGVVDDEAPVLRSLGAGALLGAAATMRTEALVYALVAVGACGLFLLARRRVRTVAVVGLAAVIGFGVPWSANLALEDALGGISRGARATGAARTGLGEIGDRAHEALVTLFAARSDDSAPVLLVGVLLAALVVVAIRLDRDGAPDRALRLAVVVVVLEVVLALAGLGFVPGLFAAAPVAAAGLALRRETTAAWYVTVVALGALPLVWAFQFLGGALPQWAGRYALSSGALLVVLGVVALGGTAAPVRRALVGAGAVVTLAGVAWTVQRGHDVDRWFRDVADRPEDVLVSRNAFFVREGGAASDDRRWLTAVTGSDLEVAVRVVEEEGLRTYAIVDDDPTAPDELLGSRLVRTTATDFLGSPLYLHSYELEARP